MPIKDPVSGPCFNCGEQTIADNYCFGCKLHICSNCDVNLDAGGHGHDPNNHLIEGEDTDWEGFDDE